MKSPVLFSRLAEHGPRLVEGKLEARDASADVPARVLRLSIETMLEVPTPNLWEGSLSRIVDFVLSVQWPETASSAQTAHQSIGGVPVHRAGHGMALAFSAAAPGSLSAGVTRVPHGWLPSQKVLPTSSIGSSISLPICKEGPSNVATVTA